MEEDLFIKSIGEFGMWQAIMVSAVYCEKLFGSWQLLAFLVIAADTPFNCASHNMSNGDVLERYSSVCEDNCSVFKYDRSVVEDTITSEWGLVCDRAWMIDFSQSIFMLGMLIGQPLFGYLSDRHGRRKPIFIALAIVIIGIMGVTFESDYPTFSVFRFISGLGIGASLVINFVILMESSGNKYREIICNLYQVPFTLAEISLAGIGYALRRWRILYFAISIPYVLLGFVDLFISESPRWLISVGKREEAENVMKSIAQKNNLATDNIGTAVKQLTEAATKRKQMLTKANFSDLVKTSTLRKKTFTCCGLWFIVGLCFYGMQQYISELGHNIYTNIVISGLIQIPVPIVIIIFQKKYGRKKTTLFCATVGGVCFILLAFVNHMQWLRLLLACIGSLHVFGLFCTLYVYTSELFPTVVRNMAMGATGTLCRFGGMVAPFIASATDGGEWIPPLTFGVLCFIGAVSCVSLPETKGLNLTDNLKNEEATKEMSNAESTVDTKF